MVTNSAFWLGAAAIWFACVCLLGVIIGRVLRFRRRQLAEERCAEGCGRAATHERFEDIAEDGTPIVALVCCLHAGDGRIREEYR